MAIVFANSQLQHGGAPSAIYEWTPSVLTATPTAGDVVAATETLTNFMRSAGGSAYITNLEIVQGDDIAPALRIYLLNSNVALGTEDAAISITDANAQKIETRIKVAVGDWDDMIASRFCSLSTADFGLRKVQAAAGSLDLYAAIVSDTAAAFTTSGMFIRFGVYYL